MHPIFYMDLTAGETTAKYPTDGHGGNTATSPGLYCPGGEWLILGVMALDTEAVGADCAVTITAEDGSTRVADFGAAYADFDYIPMPWMADLPSAQNPPPMFAGTSTIPVGVLGGVPVGKTFSAAMEASTLANFRVFFTYARVP